MSNSFSDAIESDGASTGPRPVTAVLHLHDDTPAVPDSREDFESEPHVVMEAYPDLGDKADGTASPSVHIRLTAIVPTSGPTPTTPSTQTPTTPTPTTHTSHTSHTAQPKGINE